MTKGRKVFYALILVLLVGSVALSYGLSSSLLDNPYGDFSGIVRIALLFVLRPLSWMLLGTVLALPFLRFLSPQLSLAKKKSFLAVLLVLLLLHAIAMDFYFRGTAVLNWYLFFTGQYAFCFLIHGLLLGLVLFPENKSYKNRLKNT